ncbi:hypothetical protein BGZ76_003540 [Entomortierella beljakovae]|nr:hypothetical protein BGZ76_003540 [Entomortierella beljakovae]
MSDNVAVKSGGIPSFLISIRNKWRIVRTTLRKPFAEFAGTGMLVVLGCGSVAQEVFLQGSEGVHFWNIAFGFGIALTAGIYCSAGISGGHLNPAVTIVMALFRGFPWAEVPLYILAQFLGGFCGALTVYLTSCSYFKDLPFRETQGIFFTQKQNPHVTTTDAFVSEMYGTAVLIIIILSTSDHKNTPAGSLQPLIIGLGLAAIALTFGYQTGFALNPARDLGPRFFTAIAGWGFHPVFSWQNYYFWVPIVAPITGAIGGACFYDALLHTREEIHKVDEV